MLTIDLTTRTETPFSIQTKTEMFIRCGRLCCLCLKQCGVNIEAAHIIDEAAGGSNEAENGIPVCFDCHQEIGAYNDTHPRGNKLRPEELKARRDRIYDLVETGVIYAQVIAQRSRAAHPSDSVPILDDASERSKPSAEASRFLNRLLSERSVDAPARKLSLFNPQDRAQILDGLLQAAMENPGAIAVVATIAQNTAFPREQALILVEQLMRAITLYGDAHAKAEFLRAIPDDTVRLVYEGLRLTFFEDLIGIVERDQFKEVNELVPVLVNHVDAIPEHLYRPYVVALMKQARSDSFQGAPAARRALQNLPDVVARAGVGALDTEFLAWNSRHDHIKRFAEQYRHLATGRQRKLLDDLVRLSHRDFVKKYIPDDW